MSDTTLAIALEATLRSERKAALRHLLRHPFTTARNHPEIFPQIVRHRQWLGDWFAEQPGWKLLVDPAAGLARLFKVPWRADATRPARCTRKPAFDPRRYTLFCLTLAALDDSPAQTTLARLAELVAESSAESGNLRRFDPDAAGERRAFVDALRLLVDLGILALRDGDTDRYVQ
ncbi:MAG: TIGR02678 family protein, partial [Thermodesulfobacteriota bacterium]